ncbi:MAG: isoprenylcysteine carboxylmethyltransferase family protein [Methylococcaceae bacterium]|nr:isoprenylcysteine carboxylmethyltransferase family protein [Methylococcaceae bacterium]
MLVIKLIAGVCVSVATFASLLLLPAGTSHWWRVWVFLGVVLIGEVASTISLYRDRKELLNERFKSLIQEGQPLADKIIVILILVAFCGAITFIPLDVFRFHLLEKPGTVISSLGLAFFVVGWWITILALRENKFAVPVVRYQKERRHRVVDSGVYGMVRHPMYAGAVLLEIGMPLWLESYAATLLASVPIGLVVVRILIEERLLRKELAGYDDYTARVRYRLVPFIW